MALLSFLYPKFLILLLLVPLFIFIYFFSIVYNKKKAVLFANFEAMQRFYGMEFFSKNFLFLYLNLGVLVLLVFALAGTSVSFVAETSTFSHSVLIDNSGSMKTDDVLPSRLSAAKSSAKTFIDLLPVGTEISVIAFSGDAEVMQAPTTSKVLSKVAVDNIDYGPVQGTNIFNALVITNKLLGTSRTKSLVLISDGQLNVGDAPQVISYAVRNGMIVNTIAVGTTEGGTSTFNTISKADEEFLQSLASETGGRFFRAQAIDDLDFSFNEIVRITSREVNVDISFYLLLGALSLFTLNWLLHSLRFKIIP
jgi:Ca-activated chloride channel family protein